MYRTVTCTRRNECEIETETETDEMRNAKSKSCNRKENLAPEIELLTFESETRARNPRLKSLRILSAGALHRFWSFPNRIDFTSSLTRLDGNTTLVTYLITDSIKPTQP
jgi:hypothetical protein